MKYYVYTLSCPITNHVRYVGKTNNLDKRLSAHINDKMKSYKSSWIASLANKGLKPILETLDETDDERYSYVLEVYWIAQMKQWGFNLTNLTNGGEGFSGVDLKGENSHTAKITEEIAKLIIADLEDDLLSIADMCIKYNVGIGTIGNIKYGVSWTHLTKGKSLARANWTNKQSTKDKRRDVLRDRGVYDKQSVKVCQYDLQDNLLNTFDSISDAAKQTDTDRSSISSCLSGRSKTANGFKWKKKQE